MAFDEQNLHHESDESKDSVVQNETLNQIKQLVDASIDDVNSQNELNGLLTEEILDTLSNLGESDKTSLRESIKNFFEKHESDVGSSLDLLAMAVGLEKNSAGKRVEKGSEPSPNLNDATPDAAPDAAPDADIKFPQLSLKGTLDSVRPVEIQEGDSEDKLGEQNFLKGIDKKIEGQNESEIDKTKRMIDEQIGKINALLTNVPENFKGEVDRLQKLLLSIKNAVNNTTPENVQVLQSFISENLKGTSEGAVFDSASKKQKGGFDGKFGDGTLAGLNKVLENTGNFIQDVSDKLEELEKLDKLNKIKPKENISIALNGEIDPNSLLEGLPQEGVTVSLHEGQNIDTSKEGIVTVQVDVKIGDEVVRQIEVAVNVGSSNASESDTEKEQKVDEPLTLGDKQFLPMRTAPILGSEISGATFYSTIAYSPDVSLADGNVSVGAQESADAKSQESSPRFTEETNVVDNDGVYYMKKGDNIYEVKIDSSGNLCPVATNLDSDKPVIFEDNDSCKLYLANKLPQMSEDNANSIYIAWDGRDYVMGLKGYDKTITIEPMTIAGFWLRGSEGERGATLTDSLAFLNLTNYLRNFGEYKDVEFRNDNPDLKLIGDDLYVRVNRMKNKGVDENGKEVKHGKWLMIDRDEFGLSNDGNLLKRFIKYNNHEDWNDNWDRKTPNKYYKSVKL